MKAPWMRWLPLWGAVGPVILALYKGLGGRAKKFFNAAVVAMVTAAAKYREDRFKVHLDYHRGGVHVWTSRRKTVYCAYPMAWKERLAELRGMLCALELTSESHTKNWGNKGNKKYPEGISPKPRTDRTGVELYGPEDDPVLSIRQVGVGPWMKVRGRQVIRPRKGASTITWRMLFLSGYVAETTAHIMDGRLVKMGASKRDQPYWIPLKPRLMEYIKFGSPYELDFPCLLTEAEQEELKGLMAAEKASEYLEISKPSKGKARRGTKESLAKEPSTEEDLFRDRRAAKAVQKRTNRSAEEGIGEYAGGEGFEFTEYSGHDLVVKSRKPVGPTYVTVVETEEPLVYQGPALPPEMTPMPSKGGRNPLDMEDKQTWPTKEERGKGWEHPARHFRLSLGARKDVVSGEWYRESMPVILNRTSLALSYPEDTEMKITDFRGFKERVYLELEAGECLFWVESYRGRYGYPFEHMGIRLPRPWEFYKPKWPVMVPDRVRVTKAHLPCRHCGHKVWRQDFQAEVCDRCGSEAFPRAWIYVLIRASVLRTYAQFSQAATHVQIKLYGRPVGDVIYTSMLMGVDVTKPRVEDRLRKVKSPEEMFRPGEGRLVKKKVPVGIGRFLWGPDRPLKPLKVKGKKWKPLLKAPPFKMDPAISREVISPNPDSPKEVRYGED